MKTGDPSYVVRVPDGRGTRVDRLLVAELPGLSRRRVRDLLERGLVRVGGRRVRKGEYLPAGTDITVEIPGGEALLPEPEPELKILYEDRELVAIDKPTGRPGHALRADQRGTVANFLAARYPESAAAGDRPLEHGLVHRLDTDTSGVLLAARTRGAWLDLRRQFRSREVGKRYVALVHGLVSSAGEIHLPLESHPRNQRRVRVAAPASAAARDAITRYRPLSRHQGYTLLDVDLVTGTRHQIRAHLAALGHPVAGDRLYGRGGSIDPGRHLLHASAITFTHPASGRRTTIESPLPADFLAALARL